MIRLHCDPADLARIRFGFSPAWEAVTSLRTLGRGARHGVHGRWIREIGPRLGEIDLPMSTTALAAQLDVSAPTISAHPAALKAAGILTARREGRSVCYARTGLGEALLAGSTPRPP